MDQAPPVHPSEVLRGFMDEYRLSTGKLARRIKVPRTRIERVMRQEMGITADTALRLARLFTTSPEFWLNLQRHYECEVLLQQKGWEYEKIVPHPYPEVPVTLDKTGPSPILSTPPSQ